MRTTNTVATVPVLLFVLSCMFPGRASAASEAATTKEQMATIAEKKSEIAEEEAELSAEAAAIEEEQAEIEEQKATLAEEEVALKKRAAALAEKQAVLAEKQAAVAEEEANVNEQAVEQVVNIEEKLVELKAKETERGLVLTLGDVLFESDQANLKADALENLYPMVTFLKENPERHILIEGHTDSVGSEAYNLDLSQQRAAAVQTFLMRNGVSPERITARGYGEAYPVAANNALAGRQENRRVEIIVLREGKQVVDVMR